YDELKSALGAENITFIQGWHSNVIERLGLNDRTESDPPIGLVIDDLAEQLSHNRSCLPIFTGQIHHKSKTALDPVLSGLKYYYYYYYYRFGIDFYKPVFVLRED
ncbi:MAG: hypothetical protein GY853_00590, partial [PVC group bacterium]|nr:hypothetical protein [PVC group bacterium]